MQDGLILTALFGLGLLACIVLQVVGEGLLQLLGYGIARFLVPPVTGGFVSIAPMSETPLGSEGFSIKRRDDGGRVLSAEFASIIGFLIFAASLAIFLAAAFWQPGFARN